MSLGNFFVVFKIDEFFKPAQMLVQFSFDLCLGRRETQFVDIVEFSQAKIILNLVNRLFKQGASLLAHSVEKEEFQVALISVCNRRYDLLLDKSRYSLKVDKISLQRRIGHLEHIEKAFKSELHILM